MEALALLESTIDFSDQDIPDNLFDLVDSKVKKILNLIKLEIEKAIKSKINKIREGFSIAIIGAPNVGKSSLINYLSNRDVAIVSSIAGTTRDIIEVFLDIEGFAVSLFDSAGIRISQDEIESIGIKKALNKAQEADIKIVVIDATNMVSYEEIKSQIDENTFVLCNKLDLVLNKPSLPLDNVYWVSVEKNIGLDIFKKDLAKRLSDISGIKESPLILNQRHKEILTNCAKSIKSYCEDNQDITIKAFYLREAVNAFGLLFGKLNVEDLLGVIFNKFCIGK
jgi:tRNA modification GTPase